MGSLITARKRPRTAPAKFCWDRIPWILVR